MQSKTVQLAWPFALLGAAVGAQLPSSAAATLLMTSVLGLFGALISSALERVRDWQVALMSPLIGALTGATLGFGNDGFDGAAIGLVGGVGFGLLALPALVLITRRARRAHRLPATSLLGRAHRRRVWLMSLTTATLASLVVPTVASAAAQPAEAPLAQLCALATMLMAMADATIWLALAQPDPPRASLPSQPTANPYRDPSPPSTKPDLRALSALAAASLLYDALLVALVAGALLVSR
jgi:hypothetical protein